MVILGYCGGIGLETLATVLKQCFWTSLFPQKWLCVRRLIGVVTFAVRTRTLDTNDFRFRFSLFRILQTSTNRRDLLALTSLFDQTNKPKE